MNRVDHNIAWQSETVARNYFDQRFRSLPGRAFNFCEKRAIGKLLAQADRHCQIDHVLDMACGTGRISALLLERQYQVVCGDISNEMLDVAKERLLPNYEGRCQFQTLNVYDLSYESERFDCVTCFRLFQHLTQDQRTKALTELARVSKRFVVINVMFSSKYYRIIRRLRLTLGRYAPRYTCTQMQIDESLRGARLQLVRACFSQPGYNGNLILLLERTDSKTESC